MGRVTVHLHGRPKGPGTKTLIENYAKRVSSSGISLEIHPDRITLSEYEKRIQSKGGNLILLDEAGPAMTSMQLADILSGASLSGQNLIFAIGPVDGFSDEMKEGNNTISLSKMTLTHEMASAILLEQLYRASEINCGSPYHRT